MTTTYDPTRCVTAAQLRAFGFPLPDEVADGAWVDRTWIKQAVVATDGDPTPEEIAQNVRPLRWTLELTQPFEAPPPVAAISPAPRRQTISDRELLELAAKAAGIRIDPIDAAHEPEQWVVWNPLANDGDAMRLAAALKIDLEWQHDDNAVEAYVRNDEGRFYCPIYPAADYKRAIVDVAANIGKGMA